MRRTQVLGSGFVTGELCIENDKLSKIMDTSDAWIRERSGIEQRYYVKEGTTTTELGARAAEKAIADAGIQKDEIDYIVFATMTPDWYFPGCGGLLQHRLGLRTLPALDIRQQCSGFVYGMQICQALLASGEAKCVLFVGAEIHSGFMPWSKEEFGYMLGENDCAPSPERLAWNTRFRDRTVLFGDAGGAMILKLGAADDQRGFLGFKLHSDGADFQDLYVPSAGFAKRPYYNDADFLEGLHVPAMNGRAVYKQAVKRIPEVVRELVGTHQLKVSDIDMIIPHQANLRINEAVQRDLEVPNDRIYNNIQRYGNTTAATIPIAYDECRRQKLIKSGDLICFVGLGAGFHWGAALMRQ
jgi:3-oxoacyl-[acyl-carrier-protein] synthase III